MIDFQKTIILLQCELTLLEAELKQYDANWLPGSKSVMRDAAGRFASKASAIAEDVKQSASSVFEGAKITTDVVNFLVKDKDFRKRAGLSTGLVAANVIKDVAAKVKANPKLEAKIDQYISDIESQMSELYGDNKTPFGQALRKTDNLRPPKDATFAQKLEFQVARYQALDEAIKSPEFFDKRKEEQQELLGKVIKYSTSAAVIFALSLAPEIAFPLIMEGSFDLATALASASASASADFGTELFLEKLGIEDENIRFISGIIAGVSATGVFKKFGGVLGKKTAVQYAEKAAEQIEIGEVDLLAAESVKIAKDPTNPQHYLQRGHLHATITKDNQDLRNCHKQWRGVTAPCA